MPTGKTKPVRIPQDVHDDIMMLKIAWRKATIGEVLRQMVAEHRHEIIRALDIKVEDEE